MEIKPDLSERLKVARAKRDYTQGALARLSGVSVTTISEIEHTPGRNVNLYTVRALADALGVSTAWLCGFDD